MKRPQITQEIIDRNYPETTMSHKHGQAWFDSAPLPPIEADRLSPYRWCMLCQEYRRVGDPIKLPAVAGEPPKHGFVLGSSDAPYIQTATEPVAEPIVSQVARHLTPNFAPGETVVYLRGTKCEVLTVADKPSAESVKDHTWVNQEGVPHCMLVPTRFLKRHSDAEQKRDRQAIEETAAHEMARQAAQEIFQTFVVAPAFSNCSVDKLAEIIYRNYRKAKEL